MCAQSFPCLASGMLVELGEVSPTRVTFGHGWGIVRLPEQSGTERRELGARGMGNAAECC